MDGRSAPWAMWGAGMLLAATLYAESPPMWTAEWIDAIWQDHLLQQGEKVAGTGALEEAFFRDALRVNPRSVDAVEQLVHYYGATAEPVLAYGAALYGRLLDPTLPLWTDAVARARAAIGNAPAAPQTAEEKAAYKAGLDAMLAYAKTSQLVLAEIEVRRLLTRFPRDGRLIENLCTFMRMSGEGAMQAMHWLVFTDLYPSNFLAANNLAAILEQLGLPGPAHDALARFLAGNENDVYLMGNAVRLAEAAGRWEAANAICRQWREAQPDAPEAWLAAARVALRQQQIETARLYWSELAKRTTEDNLNALLQEAPFKAHAETLRGGSP